MATPKTSTEKGRGLKYSASDKNVIDLSNDNELSKAVEGLHGSARYTAIQNYILELLSEQPVMLSDGKQAVVDKRDALHMANKSGQEKTAHISAIKRVVETASLIAEENSKKNGKFDYFYYYKAIVKYDGDTYPIYLNVGRARNDGVYHLYDITKKLRDTAHRVNDVGRPVGIALKNGISNNNIPNSDENVNNNSQKDKLKFSVATESGTDTDTQGTDFTAEFKTLMQSFQNGEISQDEYMRRVSELYQQSINENGEIPQGEMVTPQNKPFAVPKSVKDGTKVRQHVRTILESGMATEGQEGILTEQILSGKLSYTPTSDEKRIKSVSQVCHRDGSLVSQGRFS